MAEGTRPEPSRTSGPAAPEVRHLLERLREAKHGTGLSFAALAARTSYSKSSWERYLNGRTLPPRDAVETLAKLSGTDPARLLALWRLADRAWSGRDARDTAAGVQAAGQKPSREGTVDSPARADVRAGTPPLAPRAQNPNRRAVVAAMAGAALAAALGAGSWATWAWTYGDGREEAAPRLSTGPCRGESCTGRNSEQRDTDCWADAGSRARREIAGRVVELRVSLMCRASWGRITEPRRGDRVWVETTDEQHQSGQVAVPNRAIYTLMIGIERPSDARACFELAGGRSGCTAWGR
ncbi:helix-turn-helix domain-containing protein [Streptomyces scabiei]|uniref:helix-turn-helix domain-containing protein n=1 Tax=Streptomyces scabiei TaxID=1930 RepID=UPI00068FB178|nr:XRE family transcriptional regulator [Streptomyces scabiei]MDX2835637.1 helix-turn-helix domain-containing protein [Streptomyces scabiei]MDX3680418.1 helix-turn-helix domain-containing protein [Streptomyces scabiei]